MDKLVEQWAGIPQQQRYAIAIVSVVLIVAGYWYFFHTDSVRQLDRLQKNLRKLSQERTQQIEYVARLAQYEAKFNQLQQDLNDVRSQLPDEADVPQLLAQLDNNARQSGLNIARFEPQPETDKGFYAEVEVNMEVEGSFHEVGTFVDAVGKMDRIVNVRDIRLTKPKTVNSKVVVNSKFSIRTYRFVDESEKPDAKKKKKK